jgi:hypothetical protein
MMFFWVLVPSSGLKMETCFSKTLTSTDQSTWRQNPEHHHHYRHCRENLKFPVHVSRMDLDLHHFLDDLVHTSGFLAKIVVSCSWVQWPRFILCSAMSDFSGW